MNCLLCFERFFYLIKNDILFVKFLFELVFVLYCNDNCDILDINIIVEKVLELYGYLFEK